MSVISELLAENVVALVNANSDGIEEELRANEEAKLNISISGKLKLIGGRAYLNAAISYSRKFSDEVEASVEIEDPRQPKLGV